MGNTETNSQLLLYGNAQHPIHGEITAFHLKSQRGRFIMKINMKINKMQLELFQKIGQGKNNKLVSFYGVDKKDRIKIFGIQKQKEIQTDKANQKSKQENIQQKVQRKTQQNSSQNNNANIKPLSVNNMSKPANQSPQQIQTFPLKISPPTIQPLSTQSQSQQSQQYTIPLYIQFLNWDLPKQVFHISQKKQNLPQQMLWEIIDNLLQACKYLQTFGIYPQIKPKYVQFTAGKQPKLYWFDILPNNLHRAYQRYIKYGQFRHTIYSPQQLLQIHRMDRTKLNMQKCVIFSLGAVLLQACSKISIKYVYNFQQKIFSQVKKRQLFDKIKGIYSKQFQQVLLGMLEYFSKDRYGYKQLSQRLDIHYKRNIALFIKLTEVNQVNFRESQMVENQSKVEQNTQNQQNLSLFGRLKNSIRSSRSKSKSKSKNKNEVKQDQSKSGKSKQKQTQNLSKANDSNFQTQKIDNQSEVVSHKSAQKSRLIRKKSTNKCLPKFG